MNYTKVVGIDPGVSGAIAVWKDAMSVSPMPCTTTVKNKRSSKETDIRGLRQIIEEQKKDENLIVFIERVSMWMDDSKEENKGKQFRINKMIANYQSIVTVLKIFEVDFIEVHPRTWQSYLNLWVKGQTKTDRKNKYKKFAMDCYPGVTATGWSADAICLVEFGRRKLEWDPIFIKKNVPMYSKPIF